MGLLLRRELRRRLSRCSTASRRADDYDAVYQYDALGRSAWIGTGGEQAWYASRFRCVGSGDVAAVSFYTPVPGTAYEVRVAGSVRGVAAAPVAASGTVPVGGYHTIRLDSRPPSRAGDVFVAAVRVTTPGWSCPCRWSGHRRSSTRGRGPGSPT